MSEPSSEATVHPIVELAARIIAERSPSPPHTLDEPGAAEIAEELRRLASDETLKRAVADLIRLACHLDTEAGSPDAARRLMQILEAEAVEPLQAMFTASGEAAAAEVAEKKRELDRFRGDSVAPKAPRLGDGAPKGSVKLGSLDYPKRG